MKLSTFSAVAALALAQGVLADDPPAPDAAFGLCLHTTTKLQTVATSTTTVNKRSTIYTTPVVHITQYDGKTLVFSTDVLTVGTVTRHAETIENIPTTVSPKLCRLPTTLTLSRSPALSQWSRPSPRLLISPPWPRPRPLSLLLAVMSSHQLPWSLTSSALLMPSAGTRVTWLWRSVTRTSACHALTPSTSQ